MQVYCNLFSKCIICSTLFCFELEMVSAVAPEANPYGPPVAPDEAPSAITQAVASLPPEQMFELMKQMKVL